MDCLFCKIVAGEINTNKIFENDQVLAFEDINPQAPIHLLIIPKKHLSTVNHVSVDDQSTMGALFVAAQQIAQQKGFAEDGYRLVVNCNEHGGQTVFHIHMHLLAGRQLGWPPG